MSSSFDPILFLYLQPEIQVQNNLDTVEKAYTFYQNNASRADEEGWRWSLDFLPPRFNARLFLAQAKDEIDSSPVNQAIRDAMRIEQGVDLAALTRQHEVYVPTIYVDAKVRSVDSFIVIDDAHDDIAYFHPGNLNPEDKMLVILKSELGFEKSIYVTVKERLANHIFSVREPLKEHYVGTDCTIYGIRAYDVHRLAAVTYMRLEKRLGKPPTSLESIDTSFNAELFRLLYPQKRKLDDATAYLEYQKQNKYDIGTVSDISAKQACASNRPPPPQQVFDYDTYIQQLYTPSITFEQTTDDDKAIVPSNIDNVFYNLKVRNTLTLDVSGNTGYLRFNDQDVYYITTDATRRAVETDPFFQGLITERAIKEYIDQSYRERAEFRDIVVKGDAEFRGSTRLEGSNNVLRNAHVFDGALHHVEIDSNSVFRDVTIRDSALQDVDVSRAVINDAVLSNVEFVDVRFSTFSAESLCIDAAVKFASNVYFDGPVRFRRGGGEVDFEDRVVFHNAMTASQETTLASHVHVWGDLEHRGNRVVLGDGLFDMAQDDGSVTLRGREFFCGGAALFDDRVTFADGTVFDGYATFSNQARFREDVLMDKDVTISGKAYFTETNLSNLDLRALSVESNLTVTGTARFEGDVRFERDFSFHAPVAFSNAVYMHAPLACLDDTTMQNLNVRDNFVAESRADFCNDVHIGQDVYVQQDIIVQDDATVHGKLESLGDAVFQKTADFHGRDTYFHHNVHVLSNIIFYQDLELPSHDINVRDILFTRNDACIAKNLHVPKTAIFRGDVHLGGGHLHAHSPSTFTAPVHIMNTDVYVDGRSRFCTDRRSRSEFRGEARFDNTATFADDIVLSPDVSIAGDAHFLSNILVDGVVNTRNLRSDREGKKRISVSSPMTWKKEAYFEKTTDFLSNVRFLGNTAFRDHAQFHQDVSFLHPVTSAEINELVVPDRLRLEGALHAEKDATVNGRLTWCNENMLTSNSVWQGFANVHGETHHHGPVTIHDDLEVLDNAVFASSNVSFAKGFAVHEPARFHKDALLDSNLRFVGDREAKIYGDVAFEDRATFREGVRVERDAVFEGDALFRRPLTFHVPVLHDASAVFASQTDTVFSNAPLFEKSPRFLQGADVQNALRLHPPSTGAFLFDGVSRFSSNVTFEDTLYASRADLDALTVRLSSRFHDQVVFSNTTTFEGETVFLDDLNLTQQTVYGTPTFAEDVFFAGTLRGQHDARIKRDLYVNGHTYLGHAHFSNDTSMTGMTLHLRDARLNMESNSAFTGDLQFESDIHSRAKLVAHDRAAFRGPAQFSGDASFSNPSRFRDDVFIDRGLWFTDSNRVYGRPVFESNVSFLSGIQVRGEQGVDTRHVSVSNGTVLLEPHTLFRMRSNSDFIMQDGGIASFCNQQTEFHCPVQLTGPSAFSNSAHFTQRAVFRGDVLFDNGASTRGNTMTLSNLYVRDGTLASQHHVSSNLEADDLSFSNASGVHIHASNLSVDDTTQLSRAYIRDASASNLSASNISTPDIRADVAQISNLRVETDSEFANITVTNEVQTKDLDATHVRTRDLFGDYIDASNVVARDASFAHAHINDASNDYLFSAYNTLVHTDAEDLQVHDMRGNRVAVSNMFAAASSNSNLYALNGMFDVLSSTGRTTLNDMRAERGFIKDATACNFRAEDGRLETLEVSKTAKVHDIEQTSSNATARFKNISAVHACNDTLRVGKRAVVNGPSYFNNDSFFRSNARFDGPVEMEGGFTLRRGDGASASNALYDTELTHTSMYGNVQFHTTPVMKKNLAIEGALLGPRIGIGPYHRTLRLGSDVSMNNVIYLNSRTNTKIFGNKRAPQQGLNGGEGTLEVLFYPNAIVNLDKGMQPFRLFFAPRDILDEMIGQAGSVTFIEKSIHGRNVTFDPVCVFSSTSSNDTGDARVIKTTTPSPDIYGGYALDIMQYTILSKQTILCDYKNVSIVRGDTSDVYQPLWTFRIDTDKLRVRGMLRDDAGALVLLCHRRVPVRDDQDNFISFSDDMYSNSPLEFVFILFIDNTGTCTNILRTLHLRQISLQDPSENALYTHISKDAHATGTLFWVSRMIYDDGADQDRPLVPFEYKDAALHTLHKFQPTRDFAGQSVFVLVFQEYTDKIKWTRTVKNLEIIDQCLLRASKSSAVLGNGSKVSHEILVQDATGFTVNELDYQKGLVLTFDRHGALRWNISCSEKVSILRSDDKENVFIGHTRIPEHPATLRDGKDREVPYERYFVYDEGFRNASLIKLNKHGEFAWFAQVISRGNHTLWGAETLENGGGDILTVLHADNLSPVYSYNAFNALDMDVSPKEVGKSNVGLSSWESFLVLVKYNTKGVTQWMSLISNVSTTRISPPPLTKSSSGGFYFAFRPETHKHDVYQTAVFDAENILSFLRDEQTTQNKNLVYVLKYSNKGKVEWSIELERGHADALGDLSVTEVQDGGVCLASGRWSDETGEQKSRLTDAQGNTRSYAHFRVVKLTSRGVIKDENAR